MARAHMEFIFSQALPWRAGTPLAGRCAAECKILSDDPETGEMSALVRFPAGWSATVASDFEEEVYVLDGALEIDGVRLGRDGYFRAAPQVSRRWCSQGAVALVMLNVASEDAPAELVAVDTPAMPWDRSGVPPELDFMGIARKALFVDADTGEHRTWLLSVAPQIAPAGAALALETHGCAEEVFMLSGDITGPYGQMTPGAYFWRPRETLHGPFGSRNGGLALSRFRHGPQTTVFHDRTGAFAFNAAYRPELPPAMQRLADFTPEPSARY